MKDSNITLSSTRRPVAADSSEGRVAVVVGSEAVLTEALGLLRDPSPVVRRSAAEYIREHAAEIKADPHYFSELLLNEHDELTLECLIAAVPRCSGGTQSLVATLVFLTHDSREFVAAAAAASLGDLGQLARGAFVPMWMHQGIEGDSRGGDLRGLFEARLSGDARSEYYAVGARIDEISSQGHDVHMATLRAVRQRSEIGLAEVPRLELLHALCGVSDEARSEALALCSKHSSAVAAADPILLQPAIAAAMVRVGRSQAVRGLVSSFFHACSQLGPAVGLGSVLAQFDVLGDVDHKLLRDFAAAIALRDVDATLPIERIIEELWHPDPTTVQSASTNLAVLVPCVQRALGERVVRSLFDALDDRKHDDQDIVDALVAGIVMLDGFDDEVVASSGEIVAKSCDGMIGVAMASILAQKSLLNEPSGQKARSILRYLEAERAARAAGLGSSFRRS